MWTSSGPQVTYFVCIFHILPEELPPSCRRVLCVYTVLVLNAHQLGENREPAVLVPRRSDAVFHHGAAGVPAPLTGAAALDICDLRGGGVPMVKVGNEAFVCREKRLENQKNFLASRKVRHDAALEEFQRAVDVLSEECQQEVEGATTRVKKDLEEKVVESNAILEPLEPPPLPERPEGEEPLVLDETTLLDELHDLPLDGTIDPAKAKAVAAENAALKALRALGERTEGEVRGILKAVEA